jgi:hypothetical protein
VGILENGPDSAVLVEDGLVVKALSPVSTAYVVSGSAFEAPLRRSKAGGDFNCHLCHYGVY